jgi:hypothetical protein
MRTARTIPALLVTVCIAVSACEREPGAVFRVPKTPERTARRHQVFRPAGGSVTVVVRGGSDGEFIIKDGVPVTKRYVRITEPVVSADGSTSAFLASRDGRLRVVRNGTETVLPGGVAHSLTLDPTGNSVAYAAGNTAGVSVFRDGEKVAGPYYRVGKVAFSPDGHELAFAASEGTESILVRNGKRVGAAYDTVWDWTFARSGQIVAAVERDDRSFVVRDDQPIAIDHDTSGMNSLFGLVVSEDGSSVAYGFREDPRYLVFRDNRQIGDKYTGVSNIVLSRDGSSIAFAARQGEEAFVVWDGRTQPRRFERIGPIAFSPDEQVLAYWARSKGAQWTLVKDNMIVASNYSSVSPITTQADETGAQLVTAAVRRGSVCRLTIPW